MPFHTFLRLVATLLQCVSIHIPYLLPLLCNTFLYIFPICCHSIAMRFHTYSPFVATLLQCVFCTYSLFVATPLRCVSVYIPHLLPHRCNAFLYIFPICCHYFATRFYTYSLFVATPLQCVSVHIPYLLPLLCNTLVVKWLCKKAKSAMRCPQFGFTKI